jgi:N-acetylglutamate synthase-like GNAT family acetyltransferase
MERKINVRRATSGDAVNMSRRLSISSARRENYLTEAITARFLTIRQIDHRLREGPIWVAVSDGEIVGSISIKSDADGLNICSLAVRKDAQEQVVTLELLKAVNEFAEVGDLAAHLNGDFYTQLVRATNHGRL